MNSKIEKVKGIVNDRQLVGDAERIRSATFEIERLFPNGKLDRVLLVSPPDTDSSMFNYETSKRGRYWNFPPYGLGTIATHLRNDGITVDIINLNLLQLCQDQLAILYL